MKLLKLFGDEREVVRSHHIRMNADDFISIIFTFFIIIKIKTMKAIIFTITRILKKWFLKSIILEFNKYFIQSKEKVIPQRK